MHHVGPIAGVAAYGPWVATAGYDNRLILWDAAHREAVARGTHDHLVNACDFSHDGRWLVSASSDHSARIWSVPDLHLHAVLGGHGDDVDMARFSPDDSLIATCALDRLVRVFDASGHCRHTMAGHTGNVLSLVWLDRTRFVTSSVDGTLREWSAVSGTLLSTTAIGVRADCVEIAADGRILAGDDLGRITVLDAAGDPVFVVAHDAGIKKLVLGQDGRLMVTLAYDRTIAVWRLAEGDLPREIGRSELPAAIWARAAAICPDGRIAVGTFGGTYALFDCADGSWDLAGVEAGPAVNAITATAGGIATIGDAGVLRIAGEAVGGPGSLCNFLIEASGRLLAGGHLGELYDARSGVVLHRHHSPLNCATTFTRGGLAHLAIGTYTGEILVFALAGAMPILVNSLRPHGNAVKGLAAVDGVLMSVCANTDIAWHDTRDWHELARVAKAHDRIANACVALAGGGFASVGRDRMLRLWLPGGDVAFLTPHPNSVKCMAASPCGRWIASGSYGGTIVLFDRATKAFEPMHRISKAGVATLVWNARYGAFLAATYDGAVHDIPLPALALAQVAA